MTIAIDAITHKKLVLVKQLHHQAVVRTHSPSGIVARVIGLICFDLSVETVLKIAVSCLDPSKTPADSFQGLIQQCETLMTASSLGYIPDKANIQHIHSLRNDAQHKAKYPNDSDINDCRTYCSDFHNKFLTQLWGISIDAISLTGLIQHADVKNYLVKAESNLLQGKYLESVENASAGLTMALNLVKNAIVGRTSHFRNAFMMSDLSGRRVEPDTDVFSAFQRMQNVLLYLTLGMDYSDYMHYIDIAGLTSFTLDGKDHHINIKQPLEPNDAEFVVAYCINTVVTIEEQVGKLDSPFGKDRLYWF
jgi:hypothetical protein